MKNSPLQLEQYFLTALHVDANLAAKPNESSGWQLESQVGVARHQNDARKWKVELSVTYADKNEQNSPYKIRVGFCGFFAVMEDAFPKDKVQMLVETNGPSVLFAAAREMIANVTGRGPWPAVYLPTQSFVKAKPEKAVEQAPTAAPAK